MLLLERRRRQYGYYHGVDNSNRYRDLESNHLDNRIDDKDCNNYEVARNCYFFLILSALSSKMKGVLKYMSEAVISRRGGSGSEEGVMATDLIIISDNSYAIPNHKGNISVRIFGGGGGGNGNDVGGGGGGGGWMNNGEFSIANGTIIPIIIGDGGRYGKAGGTTSFGTYLSANGGSTGSCGWNAYGGDGGSGGGAGSSDEKTSGGTGWQFGGGGGTARNNKYMSYGTGGQWGGNGGNKSISAESGFTVDGITPTGGGIYGGGGGYGKGANGGTGGEWGAGGGGGYFAPGGDGNNTHGGGGGSYGKGGGSNGGPGIGGGGSSNRSRYEGGSAGGSGVCIIQYYT